MRVCAEPECSAEVANSGKCREHYNQYMKQYMKERYHRRRGEYIAEWGGKCVDCGSTENLEFDHINASSKMFNVAKAFAGWTDSRIRAELEKCVLRCSKHHLEKSRREDLGSVEHGGGLTDKKNCRCNLCAPLKNAYSRKFKERKKAGL